MIAVLSLFEAATTLGTVGVTPAVSVLLYPETCTGIHIKAAILTVIVTVCGRLAIHEYVFFINATMVVALVIAVFVAIFF